MTTACRPQTPNGAVLVEGTPSPLIRRSGRQGRGFTAKRGTLVKGIRLTNNPPHIEGKVNGMQIVLVAAYLKKAPDTAPAAKKRPQALFLPPGGRKWNGATGKLDYPGKLKFRGMPSPGCQCANGETLPGTHGETPGTMIPMTPKTQAEQPMASKKEIKKQIAARQAKIAASTKEKIKAEKALKPGAAQ